MVDGLSNALDPEGFNFGGQIGYNVQTSGNLVLGVEGDFTLLNADDSSQSGPVATTLFPSLSYDYGNGIDAEYMVALRARAGVAFGQTLVYATGGWAWTRAEFAASIESNGGYDKAVVVKDTLDGFTVGGGVEHRFSDALSARLDYSYADQGSTAFSTEYQPGSTFVDPPYGENFVQDLDLHLFRVGLNFHF